MEAGVARREVSERRTLHEFFLHRLRHQLGKPDFVFRRERVAVFVDGRFWHGCPKPKHAPLPKSNAEFWAAKLGRNRERDLLVTKTRASPAGAWRGCGSAISGKALAADGVALEARPFPLVPKLMTEVAAHGTDGGASVGENFGTHAVRGSCALG